MKKLLSLLLLIPLAAIAAEHGGKPMVKKKPVQEISEHAGKGMEQKADKAAEHGGKPLPKKASEHAGTAAEHAGKPAVKKASEHAGKPVE
ncbi:MAG: hypothetical protein ABW086_16075 [Sedimenticola sp.]